MYFITIRYDYNNAAEKAVFLQGRVMPYKNVLLASDADLEHFAETIDSIVESANNLIKRGSKAKLHKMTFKTLQTHEWILYLDKKEMERVVSITIHIVSEVIGDLIGGEVNTLFSDYQLSLIRDSIGENIESLHGVTPGEDELGEEYLDIINVIQEHDGYPTFDSLKTFNKNTSGLWSEIKIEED